MADIDKRECNSCGTKIVHNPTNKRIDISKVAGRAMCPGCSVWMRDLQKKEAPPE